MGKSERYVYVVTTDDCHETVILAVFADEADAKKVVAACPGTPHDYFRRIEKAPLFAAPGEP